MCRSEQSKGVYCLQYDDDKIVSGLRDNTIKIWDRNNLECTRILQGHTGLASRRRTLNRHTALSLLLHHFAHCIIMY